MTSITVVKESRNYVVIKLPRKIADDLGIGSGKNLTEKDLLTLSKDAIKLRRRGRLPALKSLRDFR